MMSGEDLATIIDQLTAIYTERRTLKGVPHLEEIRRELMRALLQHEITDKAKQPDSDRLRIELVRRVGERSRQSVRSEMLAALKAAEDRLRDARAEAKESGSTGWAD
jgi:hypothetical protein